MSDTQRPLQDYQGYVLDLDGTIYLGEALMPGAEQVVTQLREAGKRVAFISNKPIGRAREYAAKLTRLGIPAREEEVINSPVALRLYLSEVKPGARLFVIGEAPVREELTRGGFEFTDDAEQAEVVVVSWDREVSWQRLNQALQALRRGACFVATHPDVTCPTAGGEEALDAGAFIAMFEAASGRQVQAVAGKPSPLMLEVILRRWDLPPAECLVVGDRLETDIELGRNAGVSTCLVLTGVTRREQLAQSPVQPDYVLESIADLW